MSIQKPKFDMKTILYLLIIILIIVLVAYAIANSFNESEEILSVNNVLLNKNSYIGDTIKVKGIFHSETEEENYLKQSFTTNLEPSAEMLNLNLNQLNASVRENLSEDNQYIVTGTLMEIESGQDSQILDVELVVSKVEEL